MGIEIVYCLDNPNARYCKEGHGFDPERQNLPMSSTLEVRQSSIGEEAGRGVFAKVDIPEKSYIGLEKNVISVIGDAHSYELIMKLYDITSDYYGWDLYTYIRGYVFRQSCLRWEKQYWLQVISDPRNCRSKRSL